MSLAISLSPPAGALGPEDPLVFVITPAGAPDTLTATVTLPDGSTELAWDFDQTLPGYTGSLDVSGGSRTYTIRRALGWPLGGVSLAVVAGTSGGGETLLYDATTTTSEQHITNYTAPFQYIETAINLDSYGTGTLRLAATIDARSPTYPTHPSRVQIVVQDSGGFFPPVASNLHCDPVASYATYTAQTVLGATYVEWTNTTGLVLRFSCGTSDIGASVDDYVKNLHIRLWSEGGPESASAARSWTVGASGPLVDQARSRVLIQYRQSTKLLRAIDSLAFLAQQIVDCANDLPPLDDPDIAGGVNLDVDGEIVGQGRVLSNGDVATDGQYRVLIRAKGARNVARVSSADFLESLVTFFGARVVLVDLGGMSISYVVMRAPTADEIAVLDEDIVPRPMGVKEARSFSAGPGYFGWADDPDALGFSEISDGGTTGGFWTELF